MTLPRDYAGLAALEWLETNGLGGYALGTVAGCGTRGYHGLLAAAVEPPAVRSMVVTGMDEWLVQPNVFLSTQQYPGAVSPEGYKLLESFDAAPMPTWVFKSGSYRVERRVFMLHGENTTVVRYRLLAGKPVTIAVRPFFVWRDHHARRHASEDWWVAASRAGDAIHCAPSDGGIPVSVYAHPTTHYRDEPLWYRRFEYQRELERGLAGHEDAFAPFVVELALSRDRDAALTFTTDLLRPAAAATLERDELERRAKPEARLPRDPVARRLARAADQFLVMRSGGQRSVIAGYPWFTDWGRDTMIALPGLTLVTGALDEAGLILKSFAEYLADGLLPNRFPDQTGSAEYNTIDASLWFVVAVHRFRVAGGAAALVREVLLPAVEAVVRAYQRGTHFEIREDADGLVSGGVEGLALTWMDARVGDWVVTPRMGKAVEINALWYNARRILVDLLEAHGRGRETRELKDRAAVTKAAFARVFWDSKTKSLVDVVNVNGAPDRSIRPNQLFAASLPYPLLEPAEAAAMVECVTKHLLTPKGIRTLAPTDPKYVGVYAGNVEARDAAYHQGTVWPWLLGPYVDALLYAKGDTATTRTTARKVLAPLVEHLDSACLGQVSEIFEGNAPHLPRGCPAQAWSVAELLRAWHRVSEPDKTKAKPKASAKPKAAKKAAKPRSQGKGRTRG
jgi:predicted glycogen debranching enzyme